MSESHDPKKLLPLSPPVYHVLLALGGSTWQSLARDAGTAEADFLNGEIVLLGRLHGVLTPVNGLLQTLVQRMAIEHSPPGSLPESGLLTMLPDRSA